MSLFMGIDIGTTFCKAVVCDQMGSVIYRTARENIMNVSGVFAEEDPVLRWDNVCSMTREAVAAPAVRSGGKIEGVGISCAGAIMAVDTSGQPLTNAIMQMDKRAMAQMLRLRKMERDALLTLQNPVTDGVSSLQLLLYLKEEHPDVYALTHKFLAPNGYLAYKLTGRYTAEISRWSTSLLLDLKSKRWDSNVCRKVAIDESKLPELVASDEVVGQISPEAAKATGLPAGTAVVAGMLDTASAGLGLGALEFNDAYLVLGTFGKLCIVTDDTSLYDKHFANFTYLKNDQYIKYIATDGGCGLAVSWFKDNFGYEEALAAQEPHKSVYALLDDKAAQVPPGSDGLIFLPNLSGGKSPTWDLNAKAVFFGITKNSTKSHFFRAILESIAYSARMNLEIFESISGAYIEKVKLCGGGSKSSIWTQIIADVLNRPLELMESPDSEACGAAYIAVKSIRGLKDYSWIPARTIRRIDPQAANVNVYDACFPAYKYLYNNLERAYSVLQHTQTIAAFSGVQTGKLKDNS